MDRRTFLTTAAATIGTASTAGCIGNTGQFGTLIPKNKYLNIQQAGNGQTGVNATQQAPGDVMQEKVNQAANTLKRDGLGTEVYEAAIAEGLEGLFLSNLAVLPTEGVPETEDLFSTWLSHESFFEGALDMHISETGTEESRSTALDGRNFLQVTTEAMKVIGEETNSTDPHNPEGSDLIRQPDEPQPPGEGEIAPPPESPTQAPESTTQAPESTTRTLESPTPPPESPTSSPGSPTPPPESPTRVPESPTPPPESPISSLDSPTLVSESSTQVATVQSQAKQPTSSSEVQSASRSQVIDVTEGFTRQVRSPFFMGFNLAGSTIPKETVIETQDLWPGQCQSIIKETRGVKVLVRPARVPIWVEPWFARARIVGYRLIWIWEFVPAEFIKSIEVCNENGEITQEINTRVHIDRKMMHFWRFMS